MVKTQLPFNIDLLIPTDNDVSNVLPVKVLDTFVGSTHNFHPDGLFSTEIFGKVGEEKRNRTYGYINLNIPILHPLLFKIVVKLKAFYGDIMQGKKFATYNKDTNDFEPATVVDGETGYGFFISHIDKLQPAKNDSDRRDFNIQLFEKYRGNSLIDKLVVMPAGMRDYFIDSTGKPSEDEINGFYKRVLGISNAIEGVSVESNIEVLDGSRHLLQTVVLELYTYIESLLKGKGKLIQGKWVTRAVFNSTRNVIASGIPEYKELGDKNAPNAKQCIVGLYEYIRSTLPLSIKNIRDGILSDVFIGSDVPAYLIDKRTLKRKQVDVSSSTYDDWMTYEGIEKIAATYGIVDSRHAPVIVEGHYLALIYKGGSDTYKVILDIDTVPKELRKDVHPITMTELLYLSVFKGSDEIPGFVTRYPITGYGSINIVYAYLKTTNRSESRIELDDEFKRTDVLAKEFPIPDESFFDSLNIPPRYLGRMGGDFDGDTVSFTLLLTDEAKLEMKRKTYSKDLYVGVDNRMFFTLYNDISELVVINMTG